MILLAPTDLIGILTVSLGTARELLRRVIAGKGHLSRITATIWVLDLKITHARA